LDSPFVIGTQGHDYTSMIDHALGSMGVKNYRIALRISNFEGMKKAIMAGIGIGILPRFAVDAELSQGTLGRVMVKDANFSSSVILVESQRVLTMPAVEHIKRVFVTELQSA